MPVLITHSTTLIERLVPEEKRTFSSIKIAQSMNNRHTCLCCSSPLLRHVCLGKLYWWCNHCYQVMPVIEDAKEIPLVVTHTESLQSLLIVIPFHEQQYYQQESRECSISNLAIPPTMILSNQKDYLTRDRIMLLKWDIPFSPSISNNVSILTQEVE